MLHLNATYIDNDNRKVHIRGRVKDYDRYKYVWSISGDWYDEQTGAFVTFTREKGRFLLPVDSRRSISNHNPVVSNQEIANARESSCKS